MPRSSSDTRARLLRAGEEVFARDGVRHGQLREVVRRAGQANDSAVHYHFGSREGLVLAIYAEHIAAMEPPRARWLAEHADREPAGDAGPDLAAITAAVLDPLADRLESASGRRFLQIAAQVAGEAGIGTDRLAAPLQGTAILRQLDLLHDAVARRTSAAVARGRVAAGISLMTSVLAQRARTIDAGHPPDLDHAAAVGELHAMVTGLVTAPTTQHPPPR